jgi:hypothetical protein
MPDALQIYMASNNGHFAGDITTGTYTLTSDDAQAATCDICIILLVDTTLVSNAITEEAATYIATGGTLTLTSVANSSPSSGAGFGTGTIAGSLTNVTFQQVTVDQSSGVSTPVGSCTSSIASLSFSAPSSLQQ